MKENIETLNRRLAGKTANEVLAYFAQQYGGRIALASSFGAEDQVLTHLLQPHRERVRVFTIDTGRLPYETYDVMDRTNQKYGMNIDVYFPDPSDVEALYKAQGINGFYDSVENRRRCCHARKIAPLKRALRGVEVWITGLRREQSPTRESMRLVEHDEANGLLKLNPLIEWSEAEVWEHLHANGVPYNRLHDHGYPSIGCAPCTRAVVPGDDIRSGRWWWESPEHKECGLHRKE
ncbi:phosphoadenylyl-sulfate reductase [Sulfurimonas sp. HSL1-6]|uniref:phosphoadenylyl-sulfate reductase n=1 Tax=Thiomicrolovo immobilis TaxID=3131935 RepID=UPI0031F7BCE6